MFLYWKYKVFLCLPRKYFCVCRATTVSSEAWVQSVKVMSHYVACSGSPSDCCYTCVSSTSSEMTRCLYLTFILSEAQDFASIHTFPPASLPCALTSCMYPQRRNHINDAWVSAPQQHGLHQGNFCQSFELTSRHLHDLFKSPFPLMLSTGNIIPAFLRIYLIPGCTCVVCSPTCAL